MLFTAQEIFKPLATEVLFFKPECFKFISGPGSAPDPKVYDATPDSELDDIDLSTSTISPNHFEIPPKPGWLE